VLISIRRARPGDAAPVAAVHAASWRSAYAGILPAGYLAALSEPRLAEAYRRAILDRRAGHAMFVAVASGSGQPGAPGLDRSPPLVVGFASGGRSRRPGIAEGEIETLYVLDDYRERGVGRRLMRAMAAHLRAIGCGSAMLWVLRDNPSRWFYQRLGGRPVATEGIRFAGRPVEQLAYCWDPIGALLDTTAPASE